jgi:hypothetical protein
MISQDVRGSARGKCVWFHGIGPGWRLPENCARSPLLKNEEPSAHAHVRLVVLHHLGRVYPAGPEPVAPGSAGRADTGATGGGFGFCTVWRDFLGRPVLGWSAGACTPARLAIGCHGTVLLFGYRPNLMCQLRLNSAKRYMKRKDLVDLVRFELTTSSMPWKRAPNCATGPTGGTSQYITRVRYDWQYGTRKSLGSVVRVHQV